MKKWSAILFLLILSVNLAGAYVYFFFRLGQIKTEMRQALKQSPREHLEMVTLDEQAFVAARVEEHELKLNHRFFDIAFIEKTNQGYTVYGLYDHEEGELFGFLTKNLKRHASDKKTIPSAALGFFNLTFLLTSFHLVAPKVPHEISVIPYSLTSSTGHITKDTPPPDSTGVYLLV